MGTSARSQKSRFTRTMAIAVAAGLAVSGVQVVDTAAPLGAAVAQAQTTAITADAVKFLGIFDQAGNALTGNLVSKDADTAITAGYTVRLEVDLSKVSKDDEIDFFVSANSNAYSGGGINFGTTNTAVGIDGTPSVMQVKNIAQRFDDGLVANGLKLTGLANADKVQNGTLTINVPVLFPETHHGSGDGHDAQSQSAHYPYSNQPVKYWTRNVANDSVSQEVRDPNGLTVSYRQYVEGLNHGDHFYRTWVQSVENEGTIELFLQARTPVNPPNGKVSFTVKPDLGSGFTPWQFTSPDQWQPSVRTVSLINGSNKALTEDQRKAVTVKAEPVADGAMRVTVENIPEDALVTVNVRKLGYTDPAETARYRVEPSDRDPEKYMDENGNLVSHLNPNSPASIGGLTDAAGNPIKAERKPTAQALVGDKQTGVATTEDKPAQVIPGEETTFTLVLGNTGNTRLSNPNVTGPDGKKTTLTGVSIAPGEEQRVEVKYTPKATDSKLDWLVEYSNANPVTASAWVSTIPTPDIEVVDKDNEKTETVVALDPTTLVFTVPAATKGLMEVILPDGTKTVEEIKDGKVEVPYTFRQTGKKTIKATVVASNAPDAARGDTTEKEIVVTWPTDLSSIAELKPDCKDALITTGALSGVGLLMILGSQIRIEAIEQIMTETQKKMGIYNEQAAKLAAEWGPRLGTIIGLLMILGSGGNAIAKCQVEGSSIGSSSEGSDKAEAPTPENP